MIVLLCLGIAIILILVVLMFFVLKSTVKKINSQTKLYFVDKAQEYDYMIDEKLEKLSKINQELKEKELNNEETNNSINSSNYEFDYRIIDLLNKTKYQDKNIFEINKMIEEKFDIDYVGILKEFLKNIQDDGTYKFVTNLRNKFNSDIIYKMKILSEEEQVELLNKNLDNTEKEIYKAYLKINKKHNLDSFIDYLNELVDLNNPNITVYVGNKTENYDYLSEHIKTIYSKDIYKGIKIIYRNKIYDYSLNERNV